VYFSLDQEVESVKVPGVPFEGINEAALASDLQVLQRKPLCAPFFWTPRHMSSMTRNRDMSSFSDIFLDFSYSSFRRA
jgi:hypothetical protein